MYSLRRINNMYPGGTRSDYIITGHPEFNLGREKGKFGDEWDTIPVPVEKGTRSVVAQKVRSSGCTSPQLRLAEQTEPRPSMKARAIAKKEATMAASSSTSPTSGFDEFVALLSRGPEALPTSQLPFRVTSGAGNHLAASGTHRHYSRLAQEMNDLAEKIKKDPETAERDLLVGGSWKFYAKELERLKRQHGAVRAQHKRSASLPQLHASQP